MDNLLRIFGAWDADGNGLVEKSELTAVFLELHFSEQQMSSLFARADLRNDERIDYAKFIRWLLGPAPTSHETLADVGDEHSIHKEDNLRILVSTVNGDTFELPPLSSSAPVFALHQLLERLHGPFATNSVPVLFADTMLLDDDLGLAEQGVTDGQCLSLVLRHITELERQETIEKVFGGTHLQASELRIWNSIDALKLWRSHRGEAWRWPAGLKHLTFGGYFNENIDDVTLPCGLQSLTFETCFNQSMDNATLPCGLRSLNFGYNFNQSMDNLTLPAELQNLTFEGCFNQSMDKVTLPSGLQNLVFGSLFNQSMDNVTLPSGLLNLTFGFWFNQRMDNVTLPSSLQNLTFGSAFNQRMDNVILPSGLQNLTFGSKFNQSMDNVTLPSGLQNLTFGSEFNQLMDNVTLPAELQSITFGHSLNHYIHYVQGNLQGLLVQRATSGCNDSLSV